MDLTGQTLLVDCFHSSIEGPPPMSVHNLSHLKHAMVGKRMQKIEKWGLPGSWEEPSGLLGFPIAPAVH